MVEIKLNLIVATRAFAQMNQCPFDSTVFGALNACTLTFKYFDAVVLEAVWQPPHQSEMWCGVAIPIKVLVIVHLSVFWVVNTDDI